MSVRRGTGRCTARPSFESSWPASLPPSGSVTARSLLAHCSLTARSLLARVHVNVVQGESLFAGVESVHSILQAGCVADDCGVAGAAAAVPVCRGAFSVGRVAAVPAEDSPHGWGRG